jgi:glutamate-ammonia-ligase adenylyltransferase
MASRPRKAQGQKAQASDKLSEFLATDEGAPLKALSAQDMATLGRAAEGSVFLWGLIERDPARAAELLHDQPDARLRAILDKVAAASHEDRATLAAALRRARNEAALLIALADLNGAWDGATVTRALSGFADAAISAAVAFALREAHEAGKLKLAYPDDPERGSGYFIIGMGKLGGRELNYSSDIDLIAFFDPEIAVVGEDEEAVSVFSRVTQNVAKLLQERTADGYVARVDLRLRPDPGSTPVAIPLEMALSYYESVGQNWERAAMIKARIVAGDLEAGDAFLAELRPFIWRRSLDHASIADIHAMKRQIHVHKGHGEIAVAGHNLKLGRGGIREIEFFVQTQQLVAGGRDPSLRTRRTDEALGLLAEAGWIDDRARDELTEAYWFLRAMEHRLQMVEDAQTHTLPQHEDALERFARFAGFADCAVFTKALLKRMKLVQRHYGRLFEDAPSLSSEAGSLVFTGDEDDPETLTTLARMGYAEPASAARTVREWHRGRFPSMSTAKARELLTELTPVILDAFAKSDRPDAALNGFSRVLERTTAGVGLLALIRANPHVLDLLTGVLGVAPKLAETLARRPRVLDALLDPTFFDHLPTRRELDERVAQGLSEATSYEDALDRARIVGQELKTLIALRVAAGAAPADQAGPAFARVADALVSAVFERAEAELASAHGSIKGGVAAIVALGKLGAEEMTAASDLDLILLYDHPETAKDSDGKKPLAPSQYYARLTQRLLAALSAPTAEGVLYEVDFRLRPSGRAGPLATRLKAFETYQAEEAETWEHMALSRARVIAGPLRFRTKVSKAIRTALIAPREPRKVAKDVAAMRALLDKEKGAGGPWNLKHAPGGLVDIEFLAQALQLSYAAGDPDLLCAMTIPALEGARAAGRLSDEDCLTLTAACRLQQDLTQALRLALDGPFDPDEAGEGLKGFLARTGEAPDFSSLTATLADTQAAVRKIFRRVIAELR